MSAIVNTFGDGIVKLNKIVAGASDDEFIIENS
jgi:hypothetical protein